MYYYIELAFHTHLVGIGVNVPIFTVIICRIACKVE